MPDKLPKGWVKTTLGEVNVPSRARALPSEAPELPYVGMEHVEAQTMKLLGQGSASGLKSSSVRFNRGDVLYGKMRPYLNKVWLTEFDGLCSAEFLVFPKTDGLNSQLFAYRLNSQDFVNFANHQVSGDRPRVDFDKLASFPYLLAPTREQERIVAKLDALLSRVAAGEAAARRALDRLKRYRAAVLHAAVTGELTCDWRKKQSTLNPQLETGSQLLKRLLAERRTRWEEAELKRLRTAGKPPKDDKWKSRYPEPAAPDAANVFQSPRSWALASLDKCFQVERGKFSVRPRNDPAYYGGPHPFIQIGNLPREGGLITKYSQTLNDKGLGVSKKFQSGTILIAIVGATIANTGVLGFDACCPDSLVAVQSDDETLRGYADIWLRANKFKLRASAIASGGQPNINLGILLPFAIALPPLAEQAEIVRQTERRVSAIEHLTATLDKQLQLARALRQSLLREAFSGHLVAQNPNDEPASALFKRVRAARKAQAEKPKSKRMPRPKKQPKEVKRRNLVEVLKERGAPMTPDELFTRAGYGEPIGPGEVSDPTKAVEAFYAEVSRLTHESLLVEKRSPYDRGLVQLEAKK